MEQLLPADIAAQVAIFLVAASFVTSAISATFGMGGGLALIALIGFFLPVSALIPVHGMVQLGSNAGRAWTLRDAIAWRPLLPFFAFGAVGAFIAALLVIELPDAILRVSLGIFVIIVLWMKIPAVAAKSAWLMGFGGFVTNALTMFLGATGPLVAALFSKQFDRKETLVASSAVGMIFQHLVKVIAFGTLGFAFTQWLPLIIAMVASGYLGTLAGVYFLKGLPEKRFRRWFKIGMTLLALDLIRRGVFALIP
ncbi:MAG: sulfite exporter TauE/SafE family protein [Pseudomonadota bacterium]